MNESHKTITDLELERLADGELSAAERCEVLRALDDAPNGWRRCALVLLEEQALRREMGAIAADAAGPAAPKSALPVISAPRFSLGWLALAAALLAAFAIGVATPPVWRGDGSPRPMQLADDIDPNADSPDGDAPDPTPEESIATAPPQRPDSPDPDVVTFWTRDDSGQRQSLRTRLIDAQELTRRYGVQLDSLAPPGLREEFEESGLRVETRRRFAPLNTEDGRTLVVPVEDVQVTPITYL